MPFKSVIPQPNFPENEEEVLRFWKERKIFQKSLKKSQGSIPFVFFEGPPTANGMPGLHHVEARAFKDVILRYQTMRGRHVLRKAGWDTHGLPVEIEVEKALKISGKKEIENLVPGDKAKSIEKFNELCRENVWKYKDEWEQFTDRIGFWLDMEQPYVTYEAGYIESVWHVLKRLWERRVGNDEPLVYMGHKVLPYCPRCQTPLSSHEVAQGYRNVKENSVYVKFKLKEKTVRTTDNHNQPVVVDLERPTYLLSWTTTPWTLPGNVALAVGSDVEYSIVKADDANYILASELVERVLEKPAALLEKVKGRDLLGLSYEPLFAVSELAAPTSYKIYSADFVTTTDGTGIVHTAVMYGEDDYELGGRVGLPKFHTVDEEGRFIKGLNELSGQDVKSETTEKLILTHLQKHKNLFRQEPYAHDYPFCWRCQTPLLYYARNSWFIRISALKQELLANNRRINWVPGYIKDGRFGGWLSEIKDWAISRDRYWGTPLPFWRCRECEEYMCIGSIKELEEKTIDESRIKHQEASDEKNRNSKLKIRNSKFDPHRPYVDGLVLKCDKCGGESRRVPEVLDVWFDSGAMPYAQWHYPFENKDRIDCGQDSVAASGDGKRDPSTPLRSASASVTTSADRRDETPQLRSECQFPADYISEAIDQTRGWFYTLLAISTALGEKEPPYKNVICLGHILDGNGQKMSKSKGNVVNPRDLIAKYGVDIVRWYMYSINQPGDPKAFTEEDLARMQRRVQMIFWNVYNYFVTYAQANNWQAEPPAEYAAGTQPGVLDEWINARLNMTVNQVTEQLSAFDVFRAARVLEVFITDFSTWYLRRSRGRSEREFFSVFYRTLRTAVKILAPFMPFFAENIYQNLKTEKDPESVHLTDWPDAVSLSERERTCLAVMEQVRKITELVLAFRKSRGLKVRQPLSNLIIVQQTSLLQPYLYLLAEELNFLNLEVAPSAPQDPKLVKLENTGEYEVYVNSELTPDLKARGLARDLERAVQELRRKSGLSVGEKVELYYDTGSREVYAAFEYFDTGKTFVSGVVGAKAKTDFENVFMPDKETSVWLGIKRQNDSEFKNSKF